MLGTNKSDHSGVYRHVRDDHQGVCPRLRFQIWRTFRDPMSRQIQEGCCIEEVPEDQLLNTKQEWQPPLLGRISAPPTSTST